MNKNLPLILIVSLLFTGCEKMLVGPGPENTPTGNFDVLWKTIDEKYGQFPVKHVNWDSHLKKNKPLLYNFSEASINALGALYLNSNIEAALAIFKLNTEEYPNSSNVFDSYAEALLKNGNRELAIENYKKAVEINPGDTKGIEALEKLGVKLQIENVEVSETTLESYVGSYELNPRFILDITRDGKHLFIQATGQQKNELFPKNDKEFYLKVVNAQIKFNIIDNTVVESLTLFQNGQIVPGKKIK